jgi:predicted Zn-dependent peptidase
MVFRGGGNLTNRELVETLEGIGCDYYSNTTVYHTFFGGALPAIGLPEALRTYAKFLRQPHLPLEQLEDGRQVCLQEIKAIEDDLAGRTMLELRERFYGQPDGRFAEGHWDHLSALQLADLRAFYERFYVPAGTIIGVAGNIDWSQLQQTVGELFADWAGASPAVANVAAPQHGNHHIPFDSQQTHIALACPAVAFRDPNYFLQRCAIGVLSDGLSSRLFHEVREKRGLCYTVSASCHSILDRGAIVAYCGTTTPSAQESLDVILAEFDRLTRGVTAAELDRLRVQVRSGLIMQQESCRARAGGLISDFFHLGRLRTLDEINDRIVNLKLEQVNGFLEQHPFGPFDLVTLGEQALEIRDAISTATIG